MVLKHLKTKADMDQGMASLRRVAKRERVLPVESAFSYLHLKSLLLITSVCSSSSLPPPREEHPPRCLVEPQPLGSFVSEL
ncbi:unnamed protein product [Gadus morhua 'NCC']